MNNEFITLYRVMSADEYNALNMGKTLTSTQDWSKQCYSKGIGFCFAIGQPNLDSYMLTRNRGAETMCIGFRVSLSYALKHLHFYVGSYGTPGSNGIDGRYTLLECSATEYNKKEFKIISVTRL